MYGVLSRDIYMRQWIEVTAYHNTGSWVCILEEPLKMDEDVKCLLSH